jgi:hypothetical protein
MARPSVFLLAAVVSVLATCVTCKPLRGSDAGPSGTYFDYKYGMLMNNGDDQESVR